MVSNQSRNRKEKIEFREQLEEFLNPPPVEPDFEDVDWLDSGYSDGGYDDPIEDYYDSEWSGDNWQEDDWLDDEPCNCINQSVGSYYKDEQNRTYLCCMIGIHKYLVNILTGREIDNAYKPLVKV